MLTGDIARVMQSSQPDRQQPDQWLAGYVCGHELNLTPCLLGIFARYCGLVVQLGDDCLKL
jgi:hypothetical protein